MLIQHLGRSACHFVTATSLDSNGDGDGWLFPSLVGLAAGGEAASKSNRILESCVGYVLGLTKKHTSHGLRAGAADDLAFDHTW
mmetsp:Transcript_49745/g.74167  ORF Transcript_49745/g.74167 Transcript_49745/m.74167 type:complete len:84 (+) Transcript_49745:796-1047(+)